MTARPLRYQHCEACGAAQTLQRYACASCGGTQLAWREAGGRGVVYAVTVVSRAPSDEFRTLVPYTLALVDLQEGPRVMAHAAPGVEIGDAVEATVFEHAGAQLLKFVPAVLRFDDFVPGQLLGSAEDEVTPAMLADWLRLYPWDGAAPGQVPLALCTPLIMRAYLRAVAPRPPGNVHAAQRLRLHAAPRVGERITTRLWCEAKEMRRERRHVVFRAESVGDAGRALFEGGLRLVWAA